MYVFFAVLRLFPYWALPLILVAIETAMFARRKQKRSLLVSCLAFAAFTATAVVIWFVFRGDLHSDQWVREYFFE